MKRALLRYLLYPPTFAVLLLCPGHRTRAERFAADDGAPGPYHDRSARAREALAAAWDWWSRVVTIDHVALAGVIWILGVEGVILRGCREGWWSVLWAYLRGVASGRY